MQTEANEGKAAAITSYLTIIGTIIAYFMNNESKNEFAFFHIRQALGIHILFYLLGMCISWFDSWWISSGFYVFIAIIWGYGFLAALQGEKNEVPVLGKKFQQWFSTIS